MLMKSLVLTTGTERSQPPLHPLPPPSSLVPPGTCALRQLSMKASGTFYWDKSQGHHYCNVLKPVLISASVSASAERSRKLDQNDYKTQMCPKNSFDTLTN